MSLVRIGVILLAVSWLPACGGGGSETAVAPPQPVGNQAPVITVAVSDSAPQEGQTFTLDASTSSDPNNDALTFAWTQTSGMSFSIEDATNPRQSFDLPELTETSEARFEVEVSDGALSSTRTVTVALTNIDQSPKFVGGFSDTKSINVNGLIRDVFAMPAREIDGVSLPGERRDIWFIAVSDTSAAPVHLEELYFSATNEVEINPQTPDLPEYAADAAFVRPVGLASSTLTGQVVIEESANQVRGIGVNLFEDGPAYFDDFSFEFESPCWVIPYFDLGEELAFALVGQRAAGATYLGISFDLLTGFNFPGSSSIKVVDDASSLCTLSFVGSTLGLMPTVVALDTTSDFITLGLDHESHTITVYERFASGNVLRTAQLQTGTTVPLEIYASASVPGFGFVVALSDGEHKGTHRLVFVGVDDSGQIDQEILTWGVGVPSDIVVGNLDDDPLSATEITIIPATSSEAIVFSLSDSQYLNTSPSGSQFYRRNAPLPIVGPRFFEIGLGAERAFNDQFTNMDDGVSGLFITYPDEQVVRFFEHRCDPSDLEVPFRCRASSSPDPLPPGSPPG